MAETVTWHDEMIRISPKDRHRLESSAEGLEWTERFCGNRSVGEFRSIGEDGVDLVATTSRGEFFASGDGSMWFIWNNRAGDMPVER